MNSNFFCCSTVRSTGFGAFKDLVYVHGGAPVQVGKVHAVRHEPAGFDKCCLFVYRWELALYREFHNLSSVSAGNVARHKRESRVSPRLAGRLECRLKIFGALPFQVLKLYSQRACGEFDLFNACE